MTSDYKPYAKVSQSPTNPLPVQTRKKFDVADLYAGPLTAVESVSQAATPLDEKLRQAYFWTVNHAIISPYYDFE